MSGYHYLFRNAGLTTSEQSTSGLFTLTPNLCDICLGPIAPSYYRCRSCTMAAQSEYRSLLPTPLIFLTYGISGQQSGQHMYQYKHPQSTVAERAKADISHLFVDSLKTHGQCIQEKAQMPITGVAFVPSGKPREPDYIHPLQKLLEPYIDFANQPLIPIRRVTPRAEGSRDHGIDPHRYQVDGNAGDRHILLFEDTWVTGSNPLSTAVALRLAGACAVTVLSLARFLNPRNMQEHADWLKANRPLPYSLRYCPVHRIYDCPHLLPGRPS